MAGRIVKCKLCGITVPHSERETLTVEVKVSSKGSKKNEYWHNECYSKEIARREFNSKELEEKNELNEIVKRIYNLQFDPPKYWWQMIADLREGTNRFQKFWKKKQKQGVPFRVMAEAFKMSLQDIEWARMAKRFQSLEQEMRYGLVVMASKVNDAYRKIKTREQQAKLNEAMERSQIEDMQDNREVSFKRNPASKDYSYLLGND